MKHLYVSTPVNTYTLERSVFSSNFDSAAKWEHCRILLFITEAYLLLLYFLQPAFLKHPSSGISPFTGTLNHCKSTWNETYKHYVLWKYDMILKYIRLYTNSDIY